MTANNKTGLRATQFKTIDGLGIRFAANDKKSGDPILLFSPLPESILAFLPIWDLFSALGPVIAVDLPAFGLSESRADVRAPEPLGEFVVRIMDSFSLDQPHVVAPDVGTPACLFASANHPGIFKSLVIGSGATDHTDIGGILDEIVNAPSLEPFKDLTGEQFVRGAIEGMKQYKLPDYVLQDYLASYAGPRFFEAMAFVRDYPESLPRLAKRLGLMCPARLPSAGMIRSFLCPTRRVCTRLWRRADSMSSTAAILRGKTPLQSTESSPQTLLKVATHDSRTEFATCLPFL